MMKLMGYVYSGSRAYPGSRPRMFRYWSTKPAARQIGGGSCIIPIQEYNIR